MNEWGFNDYLGCLTYRRWLAFLSDEKGWYDLYTPGFVYIGSARGVDAVARMVDERKYRTAA